MIATLGGRFGGYGLYLSRTFNWWFHERFFRRIGLSVFVLGLLLIWLAQYRKWSTRQNAPWLRTFASSVVSALCWCSLPACVGIGRGKPVFLYNLLDMERFKW